MQWHQMSEVRPVLVLLEAGVELESTTHGFRGSGADRNHAPRQQLDEDWGALPLPLRRGAVLFEAGSE